jgi:hypothetical protein
MLSLRSWIRLRASSAWFIGVDGPIEQFIQNEFSSARGNRARVLPPTSLGTYLGLGALPGSNYLYLYLLTELGLARLDHGYTSGGVLGLVVAYASSGDNGCDLR